MGPEERDHFVLIVNLDTLGKLLCLEADEGLSWCSAVKVDPTDGLTIIIDILRHKVRGKVIHIL